MSKPNYFPLGLAKGQAFCNRVSERSRLKANIVDGRHSLIISPRRYGKSSLALYTLEELCLPYARIDFFVAVDEPVIEREIIKGAKDLINKLSNKKENLFKTLKEFVVRLKLKLMVGSTGVDVELLPLDQLDSAQNIRDVLLLLESFLKKKNKKAVLFIDEFQELAIVAKSKGIEGAIRYVAQETEYLSFIFSGSQRHLLSDMFEDRSRPLYKLCDHIAIGRIHREDYITFIQGCAKKQWREELPESILEHIFNLTACHPYYMNVLCGRIWNQYSVKPIKQLKQVDRVWFDYVLEQKSEVARELSQLSELQKKLMIHLAAESGLLITGKESLQALKVTSAAVIKALASLEKSDYVFKDQSGVYRVLDPLIKSSILAIAR